MAASDSDDRLVELLQEARGDELETVINYQTNALALAGIESQEVAYSLSADVQEELGHAEEIGERISQLGGTPQGSKGVAMTQGALQPPEESTNLRTVVKGVIEAENDAVSTYQELVDLAEDADDPVTEDLAAELLADEEEHLAEFEGFLASLEEQSPISTVTRLCGSCVLAAVC